MKGFILKKRSRLFYRNEEGSTPITFAISFLQFLFVLLAVSSVAVGILMLGCGRMGVSNSRHEVYVHGETTVRFVVGDCDKYKEQEQKQKCLDTWTNFLDMISELSAMEKAQ